MLIRGSILLLITISLIFKQSLGNLKHNFIYLSNVCNILFLHTENKEKLMMVTIKVTTYINFIYRINVHT
jgi:hypothetical protein